MVPKFDGTAAPVREVIKAMLAPGYKIVDKPQSPVGAIVRTTERLGVLTSGMVADTDIVEAGEICRVEAEDDKPGTYILVPVKHDGTSKLATDGYSYDETAGWCEAWRVSPVQWEIVNNAGGSPLVNGVPLWETDWQQ